VVLSTTISTLIVNIFFKFFAESLIDVKLDRTTETIVGVGLPIVILLIVELINTLKQYSDPKHAEYKALKQQEDALTETDAHKEEVKTDNSYSIRVMGLSISAAGLMIIVLGIMATFGNGLVISVGTGLLALGIWLTAKYGLKKKI